HPRTYTLSLHDALPISRQLERHEALLQDLRIRLHYLAGRREDRIVFDFQAALAAQVGYQDTPHRRASEAMMQGYYRTAKAVTQLDRKSTRLNSSHVKIS